MEKIKRLKSAPTVKYIAITNHSTNYYNYKYGDNNQHMIYGTQKVKYNNQNMSRNKIVIAYP